MTDRDLGAWIRQNASAEQFEVLGMALSTRISRILQLLDFSQSKTEEYRLTHELGCLLAIQRGTH